MDLEQTITKIKKCLALADSANEHEAAAAMRQAKKLMDKHNLSIESVGKPIVNRVGVNSKNKKRSPRWEYMLVSCIATFFECKSIVRTDLAGRKWVFVGKDHNPEVAAYTYEVLYAQLMKCKERYQKGLLPTMSKRQLGNYYCIGWVVSVYEIVKKYAKKPNATTEKAINEELKKTIIAPKRSKTSKVFIRNESQSQALKTGLEQGKKAQLHYGVQKDGSILRLGL